MTRRRGDRPSNERDSSPEGVTASLEGGLRSPDLGLRWHARSMARLPVGGVGGRVHDSMRLSAVAAILSIPLLVSAGVAHGVRAAQHPRAKAAKCGAVSAKYVPSCGAWFGTTGTPDLATAEAIAGRKSDIYHGYKDFS